MQLVVHLSEFEPDPRLDLCGSHLLVLSCATPVLNWVSYSEKIYGTPISKNIWGSSSIQIVWAEISSCSGLNRSSVPLLRNGNSCSHVGRDLREIASPAGVGAVTRNLFAAILDRIERLALPPPVVDGSAV